MLLVRFQLLRKKITMELFSSTGFEVGDSVWVELDGFRYHGKVVKVDDRLDRIKVDYSSALTSKTSDWFPKTFWSK
jgi:hypothetical protein